MKMSIVITNAEVREAIKAWLDDHGVPTTAFKLRARYEDRQTADDRATFEVVVETEAPHMEGPYR